MSAYHLPLIAIGDQHPKPPKEEGPLDGAAGWFLKPFVALQAAKNGIGGVIADAHKNAWKGLGNVLTETHEATWDIINGIFLRALLVLAVIVVALVLANRLLR